MICKSMYITVLVAELLDWCNNAVLKFLDWCIIIIGKFLDWCILILRFEHDMI